LLRSGSGYRRQDRPNLFYPVFVDLTSGKLKGFGESKPITSPKSEWEVPPNCGVFWPTRKDGSEGRWQVGQDTMQQLFDEGFARIGAFDAETQRGSIYYLTRAQRAAIESGEIRITGTAEDGSKIVEHSGARMTTAKSVWVRPSHAANLYGTSMVKTMLGGRPFPYPKSLYAVEDALRLAVKDKKDAVILDFFAGSGTTTQAVMRLNKQDG